MAPLYIKTAFKLKHLNNVDIKQFVFDSRWDCQTFLQKMQEKIHSETLLKGELRITFSRIFNDDVVCFEVVPCRETNILEFLNIGTIENLVGTNEVPINYNLNYNTLCFHAKEIEPATALPTETPESDTTSREDTGCCTVCLTTKKNVVFLPCRHLTCCEPCGMKAQIVACVICRTPIQQKIKIFL